MEVTPANDAPAPLRIGPAVSYVFQVGFFAAAVYVLNDRAASVALVICAGLVAPMGRLHKLLHARD